MKGFAPVGHFCDLQLLLTRAWQVDIDAAGRRTRRLLAIDPASNLVVVARGHSNSVASQPSGASSDHLSLRQLPRLLVQVRVAVHKEV